MRTRTVVALNEFPRTPARLADGFGAGLPRSVSDRIHPKIWFPRSAVLRTRRLHALHDIVTRDNH